MSSTTRLHASKRSWIQPADLAALGFFALVAVLATWPMLLHVRDGLFPDAGDPHFYAWVIPWNIHALLNAPLDVFNANIYFPEPNTLAYADHMLGLAPLGLPFWIFTKNGVFLNNAVTILCFTLNGWCAYLLAKEIVGSRPPAIVAGLIFLFAPFHNSQIGHTNLLASYPIPLTLLAGIKLVRRPSRRGTLFLALAWTLAMLSSWYYLSYVAIALGLILPLYLWRERQHFVRAITAIGVAGIIVVGASLAVLPPFLDVINRHPQANRSIDEAEHYKPLPSALLAAPESNRLWGEVTSGLRKRQGSFFNEKVMFVGITPTLLAVAGIVYAMRRRKPEWWVGPSATAVSMFLIALGPTQFIMGRVRQMPFYYLHEYVPGFQFMRAMARADVVLVLMLAILSAVALSSLAKRRTLIVISATCALLVGAEFLATPILWVPAPKTPAAYQWLASAPRGAVLELPTAEIDDAGVIDGQTNVHEAVYMDFSTRHWQPLVNGYSGFVPPSYRTMLVAVRSFPSPSSLEFLRGIPVEYVVVHRTMVVGTRWAGLAQRPPITGFRVAVDDGDVIIYQRAP